MAMTLALVLLVTAAACGAAAADSWDPHVIFVNSIKECHDKFPELEIGKLREYILKKDGRIKCFLDCLIRANAILDGGDRVKEAEAHRWMAAAVDALAAVGVVVSLDAWKSNTRPCAQEDYSDGAEKCSGAVRLFTCYIKGFPLGD